jgi:hypothetical protein
VVRSNSIHCRILLLEVALLICFAAPRASAQSFTSARLVIDNDFIAIRRGGAQDQDYSSGVRIDLSWLTGRRETRCCQLGLSIGQEMYTPSLDGPVPIPGERAYAAWIFFEPSYVRRTARFTNTFAFRFGWIGPPALGEETQNSVHQLIKSEHHVGWKHQARIGPAYVLSYRVATEALLRRNGPAFALRPTVRLATGNVETSLEAGGEVWLAQKLGRKALQASAPRKLYALFAAKGVWKARDALLRFDPEGPATPVTRRPIIGELEAGCGFATEKWAVEYRYIGRTIEYETQPSPHRYGSIRFALTSR